MILTAVFVAPSLSASHVRTKIVIVVVCAMVTVYACEAFLTWDPLELRGPHPQNGFDLREYVDVVRDFRARGVSAYQVFPITTWLDSLPAVHGLPTLPL